ncbi:unnamed protein product [Sphagnum troendelagicum]|uniref:Uncharacterized protein n=1 Tax=Sphagnum troendelagicum TaxID=128251 RepID=A0ABP0V113_9BRYO
MRVGEEEEEEELGKTEKPKGQSAEAVEPAADGRSHHRTLQRQTAGAEGLHEAGCHFRADNEIASGVFPYWAQCVPRWSKPYMAIP